MTGANLTGLPMEVMEMVASHLDRKSFAELRLTNRRIERMLYEQFQLSIPTTQTLPVTRKILELFHHLVQDSKILHLVLKPQRIAFDVVGLEYLDPEINNLFRLILSSLSGRKLRLSIEVGAAFTLDERRYDGLIIVFKWIRVICVGSEFLSGPLVVKLHGPGNMNGLLRSISIRGLCLFSRSLDVLTQLEENKKSCTFMWSTSSGTLTLNGLWVDVQQMARTFGPLDFRSLVLHDIAVDTNLLSRLLGNRPVDIF